VVYDTSEEVNDDNTLVVLPWTTVPDREDDVFVGQEEISVSSDSLKFFEGLDSKKEELEWEVVEMSSVERDVLNAFDQFELKLLSKHASLFDITTEYPDEYFEYYSRNLVMYFFSTKTYSEVYDIFDILSDELPYDINEVNNFGQSSFYINLKEVYTDEFVRLVVQYENKAFWLKIHKDSYNEVKKILEPLKAQK